MDTYHFKRKAFKVFNYLKEVSEISLTREEFKAAHNNIMTVMENHIMMIAHCDRTTANLVANEVLDLDRDADDLLLNKTETNKYNIILRRLFTNTPVLHNSTVKDLRKALECLPDNMEVFCCGTNKLWLHVDDKGNICNFDCDSLDDEYDMEE